MNNRYVIFDYVRFVSILPIVAFHIHEVFFGTISLNTPSLIFNNLLWLAQFLSFSGHTIILISAFLLAKNHFNPIKRRRLLLFLIAATFLLFLSYYTHYGFEWDIYELLIVCILYTFILRKTEHLNKFIFINASIMFIPFWEISLLKSLPQVIQGPLIGICNLDEVSGLWPILPWLGFFGFFYGVGCKFFNDQSFQNSFKKFQSFEKWLWPLLLAGSLLHLGAYFHVQFGNQYYCFINKQPLYVLWSHLIWVVLLLRLGLLNCLQAINQLNFSRWLSNLYWSKTFGLCYITHLLIMNISVNFRQELLTSPLYFDIFVLILIPVTECIVRFIYRIRKSEI